MDISYIFSSYFIYFCIFYVISSKWRYSKREEDRLLTQAKILNDNLLNQINSIEQALLSTRVIIEKDGLSDKNQKIM